MTIKIEFSTETEAFQDDHMTAVSRVLRDAMANIEKHRITLFWPNRINLYDSNGDEVGKLEISTL